MILGVLIGFAALAVVSSVIGDGESEAYVPLTDEAGLNIIGDNHDDLPSGDAGAVEGRAAVVAPVAARDPDQPGRMGLTELAGNMRAEADDRGGGTTAQVPMKS